MRRFLLLPLFSLCFIISTLPAQANEADIATLKKLFQDMLDYQSDMTELYGMDLQYEGELTVTSQEGFYTVTLPAMKFLSPDESVPFDFDFGVVKANAMRGDTPGAWKTSLTMPATYTFNGPDDTNISFNIGEQNTVGILEEKLGYFTKLDMKLGNLAMQISEEGSELPVNIAIGGLSMFQNFDSTDGVLYSGPTNVALNNFSIKTEEHGGGTVGALTAAMTLKDMKLPTLAEYKEKVLAYQETIEAMTSPETTENVSEEDVAKMMSDLYDFDLGGFAIEYGLKDLAMDSTDVKMNLASGKFGLSLDGLKADNGTAGVVFGFNGFSSSDEEVEYKDVIPRQANINLSASNIPMAQLTELISTTMESISANPAMVQMAGMGVMMKIPMLLSSAGTKIKIADTFASGNAYNTTLAGEAKADINAVTSVTADVKSVFTGIDALLAIADQYQGAQGPAGFYYVQLADTLGKLKSVGTPVAGAGGKPAHEFQFKITPEGQMLINGQDAQALMMGPPAGSPNDVSPSSP